MTEVLMDEPVPPLNQYGDQVRKQDERQQYMNRTRDDVEEDEDELDAAGELEKDDEDEDEDDVADDEDGYNDDEEEDYSEGETEAMDDDADDEEEEEEEAVEDAVPKIIFHEEVIEQADQVIPGPVTEPVVPESKPEPTTIPVTSSIIPSNPAADATSSESTALPLDPTLVNNVPPPNMDVTIPASDSVELAAPVVTEAEPPPKPKKLHPSQKELQKQLQNAPLDHRPELTPTTKNQLKKQEKKEKKQKALAAAASKQVTFAELPPSTKSSKAAKATKATKTGAKKSTKTTTTAKPKSSSAPTIANDELMGPPIIVPPTFGFTDPNHVPMFFPPNPDGSEPHPLQGGVTGPPGWNPQQIVRMPPSSFVAPTPSSTPFSFYASTQPQPQTQPTPNFFPPPPVTAPPPIVYNRPSIVGPPSSIEEETSRSVALHLAMEQEQLHEHEMEMPMIHPELNPTSSISATTTSPMNGSYHTAYHARYAPVALEEERKEDHLWQQQQQLHLQQQQDQFDQYGRPIYHDAAYDASYGQMSHPSSSLNSQTSSTTSSTSLPPPPPTTGLILNANINGYAHATHMSPPPGSGRSGLDHAGSASFLLQGNYDPRYQLPPTAAQQYDRNYYASSNLSVRRAGPPPTTSATHVPQMASFGRHSTNPEQLMVVPSMDDEANKAASVKQICQLLVRQEQSARPWLIIVVVACCFVSSAKKGCCLFVVLGTCFGAIWACVTCT